MKKGTTKKRKDLKKTRFVLLDSNIYIHLCFIDLEIENVDVLEKLKKLLDSKKFILLLPEVVELEFDKRFKEKIHLVEKEIDSFIEAIQTSKTIGSKKAKKNLADAIRKSRISTLREIKQIKKSIDEIFNNSGTIRKGLELTPETLVDGYKISLRGDKPYKKSSERRIYENIQPDSLIIASVAKYLKSIDNYELYFSTGDSDFFENPDVKDKNKLKLASSINKQFKHIEYYHDTLKMLNTNFQAGYDPKTMKKMAAQAIINMNHGVDLRNFVKQAENLITDPTVTNLFAPTILDSSLNLDKNLTYHIANKTCMHCLKSYYLSPTSTIPDDGLCDNCKNCYGPTGPTGPRVD